MFTIKYIIILCLLKYFPMLKIDNITVIGSVKLALSTQFHSCYQLQILYCCRC